MHLYGYDRRVQTLTPEERQYLIDYTLWQRWAGCPSLGELIRQPGCQYEEAHTLCHRMLIETWAGGSSPDGFRYQYNESGIEAEMPGGHVGSVPWRAIIGHARADVVQGVLL